MNQERDQTESRMHAVGASPRGMATRAHVMVLSVVPWISPPTEAELDYVVGLLDTFHLCAVGADTTALPRDKEQIRFGRDGRAPAERCDRDGLLSRANGKSSTGTQGGSVEVEDCAFSAPRGR